MFGEVERIETAIDCRVSVVLIFVSVGVAGNAFELFPLAGGDDFKAEGFDVYVLGRTRTGTSEGPVNEIIVSTIEDRAVDAPHCAIDCIAEFQILRGFAIQIMITAKEAAAFTTADCSVAGELAGFCIGEIDAVGVSVAASALPCDVENGGHFRAIAIGVVKGGACACG